MQFTIPTYNVPFTLLVGVQTKSNQCIRLDAKNTNLELPTYYVNRKGKVNGYREFELKFPQVPSNLIIDIYNPANGNFKNKEDGTFNITKFEAKPLKTYPIWLSEQDREFLKLAKFFCENASYLSATRIVDGKPIPSVYSSDDGVFNIVYVDKITDRKSGRKLNTPARIAHESGRIEVSKEDFLKYTVPMRMIILLHEYSHKYKNPKNGLEIGNESGADIAGLIMYLSLGYSEIEAHQAFLYVFKGAANEGNHKRYLIIKDFIKKFTSGQLKEFAKAA